MVDTKAGRAFIEFFLKTDKMDRDTRAMHRKMQRFGKSVMNVTAAFTALGVAAGGVAVAGIIKSVNAAGDLQEIVSKFNAVFGKSSKSVRDWADDLAASLGVAGAEVMSSMSSFQDLLVPMGMTADAATDVSKQLTQLSIDLGSFNNMASADVVRDLQSALTGSSETMKKYGSIVNATAVNQELLNQGLDPKHASEAEKAMARFNIIMRTTTAAQGDAAKTGDSYNAQVRKLAVNFGNLQEALGDKFIGPLTSALQIANEGMKQLTVYIDQVIPKFGELDEALVELARQGKWEQLGEIIGMQIELGLRSALGNWIVDAARLAEAGRSGAASGGLNTGQLGVARGVRDIAGQLGVGVPQGGDGAISSRFGTGRQESLRKEIAAGMKEALADVPILRAE